MGEVEEGGLKGLRRAVGVQVVGLDVGNDLHPGAVVEEGAVGLVGLGHEDGPAAQVRPGPQVPDDPADGEGRVLAQAAQRLGQHGGGGRLAVGAGHRHQVASLGRQGQGLGAVHDPGPGRPGGQELGVGGPDRARDHHRGPRRDAGGVVADVHPQPQVTQVLQGGPVVGVRAGDGGAALRQQLGDHAHPGAPHANEVEGLPVQRRGARPPVPVALSHGPWSSPCS